MLCVSGRFIWLTWLIESASPGAFQPIFPAPDSMKEFRKLARQIQQARF
jgi:hypothetical protein